MTFHSSHLRDFSIDQINAQPCNENWINNWKMGFSFNINIPAKTVMIWTTKYYNYLYKIFSNHCFLKLKFLAVSCHIYYGTTYYGSRGFGEPTEIPYLTQRLDDPPGMDTFLHTRQIPPTLWWGGGQGWYTETDDEC